MFAKQHLFHKNASYKLRLDTVTELDLRPLGPVTELDGLNSAPRALSLGWIANRIFLGQ